MLPLRLPQGFTLIGLPFILLYTYENILFLWGNIAARGPHFVR